jgi:copper resistance protein D
VGGITEPALRFLHYTMVLGLFGWTSYWLVGLRRLTSVRQDRRNVALIGAAIAAPLLSLALMLVSIAAMMGVPISSLDWAMTEAMIVGTDMGWAFLLRATLLIIGLCALLVRQQTKAAVPIAALCFAGALMTLGWSGHAAATEGGLGLFHRLNNGVHLLSAGLWLGAITWFLHLTRKAHRQPDAVPAQPLLAVMHCFAPCGVGLVTIVALTGLINSQLIFGLENSVAVLTTPYGLLLAAKVTLVGGMLAFGAYNARVTRRFSVEKDSAMADPDTALSALRRSLAGETVRAVSVTGLVAMLGTMSPMMML